MSDKDGRGLSGQGLSGAYGRTMVTCIWTRPVPCQAARRPTPSPMSLPAASCRQQVCLSRRTDLCLEYLILPSYFAWSRISYPVVLPGTVYPAMAGDQCLELVILPGADYPACTKYNVRSKNEKPFLEISSKVSFFSSPKIPKLLAPRDL